MSETNGSTSKLRHFIARCPIKQPDFSWLAWIGHLPKVIALDMITLNPLQDTYTIERYLRQFDGTTAGRGRRYFKDRAVLRLQCDEPGVSYSATVRGGMDYEVGLYFEGGEWDGECTCPTGYECKHIYAAMLAFQKQPESFPAAPLHADQPVQSAKTKSKPPKQSGSAPKIPDSRVVEQFVATAGRPPNAKEVAFLRCVQALFQKAVQTKGVLMAYDLRLISPNLNDYSWNALELWPEPPKDDFELWLYCAWELRRRGVEVPEFMQSVTDFSIIEPQMKAWQRSKEVAHWRNLLAASPVTKAGSEPPLDLQLVVEKERLRVCWRQADSQPFAELKQTHARKFMQSYENGSLSLSPEAEVIWASIYKPYDYHTWLHLDLELPHTTKILNRVLRMPLLADRVVSIHGTPLLRSPDPLRLDLTPAENEDGDYSLRLVQTNGQPAPEIIAVLPGEPTLYVTPVTLFTGPPSSSLTLQSEVIIPAPAMESSEGIGFLTGLGLPLPPRLEGRTRPVHYTVNLYCDLRPDYPGSDKQSVFLRAEAVAEGLPMEKFSYNQWQIPYDSKPTKKTKGPVDDRIPVIHRDALQHFPRVIETSGAKWDNYSGSWRIRLTKTFAETFLAWLAAMPPQIEVHLDRELATLRDNPVSGNVRLDVQESGVDWFDLKVVLDVSDTELTQEELKILLNAKGGYVRLGRKGWRRLQFNITDEEDDRLARIGLDARDFTAEPQRLHAFQLADEAAKKFLPEQQVEKINRRASELKARVNPPIPDCIRAELRPYQIEGFHFLAYLTANRFGGVLADDMGLGKTVQTLTWLAWLREQPLASSSALQPSLVVCPKSVMDNWRAEGERFLPGLRVRLWRGEDAATLKEARTQTDLIVLNYPQLRSLSPDIAAMQWHAVILDEAQYIKNPDSQTAQVARSLTADHRLALSGTPIENRLLDLWSILGFAMPGVLGNRAQFTRKFNAADDPLARRRLAARVRPFLLRRTKNQVAKDLPDRIEEDLLCELEGEQKTLYRAEFKRAQQLLLKVKTKQDLNENRFNFLTSLLRLRQICCHPALVNAKLRDADSAKLNALVDMLEPLMEEGHKVLVFSQFVTMLDILRDTVKARGWQHFFLSGETENRGDLVKEFQKAKGSATFLISLKAGGFGLNLTAASYVVLFDPWWNPAVESQAIDRTHRIGQTSKVIAYRLLMKNSIEEKIRALQKTKAALADDVLGEDTFAKSLTLEDLQHLFAEE